VVFPYLMLAIAVMALLGTKFINLLLVLMVSGWVSYARTVRNLVVSLKAEDFITASVSIGAKPGSIILRHVLPNTMAAFSCWPVLILPTSS